jgi:hypothetical protein
MDFLSALAPHYFFIAHAHARHPFPGPHTCHPGTGRDVVLVRGRWGGVLLVRRRGGGVPRESPTRSENRARAYGVWGPSSRAPFSHARPRHRAPLPPAQDDEELALLESECG